MTPSSGSTETDHKPFFLSQLFIPPYFSFLFPSLFLQGGWVVTKNNKRRAVISCASVFFPFSCGNQKQILFNRSENTLSKRLNKFIKN